jgi:hypothetical protein
VAESENLRVLPVVKAYPEPSETYVETVCVAAVTVPDGRWVRLYPIRFNDYPPEKKFKKYQIFEAEAVKSEKDSRPESYRIDEDTIRVIGEPIGTGGGWSERKRMLANVPVSSLCELQRLQKVEKKSLGMIRVREVTGFLRKEAEPGKYEATDKKLEYAANPDLFIDRKLRMEGLSFKYQYWFLCADPSCKGHKCSVIDWEAYELHRKMRVKHGEEGAFEKVRQKYVDQICGPDKETYFFMGNMHRYPGSFLVLGAFYPPLSASPTFFEFEEMDPTARTRVPAKSVGPEPDPGPTLFPE